MAQGKWLVTHDAQQSLKRSGYAYRCQPRIEGKAKLRWLHKEILERAEGPPPSDAHTIGDHRNGKRLDCRRANLRWATKQQNARNVHGLEVRQLTFGF